jgi:hypothetical protein
MKRGLVVVAVEQLAAFVEHVQQQLFVRQFAVVKHELVDAVVIELRQQKRRRRQRQMHFVAKKEN